MAKEKITNETEVSTSELACVLGITGRYVRQLAEDGQLNKVSQGRFLLAESVQKYLEMCKKDDTTAHEAATEKAELAVKQAKAIRMTLEAKELQGRMHRSEDVAEITEDMIYTFRSRLLPLPGRLAVDVSTAANPAEASEIIRKEIHAVMDELSRYEYDPEKYAERVRAREKWESVDLDE